MNTFKKITTSYNFWPVVVVILFGLIAGKGLIGPGYFNMHDDLQMMRQLEMEKCFLTLQIPCRWVPDMGYGFGFPLFNFYPPLPYLFGEIFRLFGIQFVDTVKLTFMFAFIASGITMYFFAKEFWGKWGGVLSAIFYIWAPYHSVDIYVRGAMDEVWAWIWMPLILLSGYKLIIGKKKIANWIIILALGWVGLLLSHNLTAMIFAPVFAGWCLIWLIKSNKIAGILQLALSGLLALSLAAFFTLPVLFEQKLVDTQSLIQGYYDYSAHFATIKQILLSRFWGYGPSVWGPNDGLTFQVGWLHWIIPIVIIGLGFLYSLRKRKFESWFLIAGYFFFVGWFAIFMMHNKSTPIWIHIPTLRFVQFPWRFLTLVILAFSFIAGAVVKLIELSTRKNCVLLISGGLVMGLLLYSWNYFLPEFGHLGALTDKQKFSGAAWDLQQTAGIYDYLPNTAKTAPKAPMKNLVEILNGKADISNLFLGTNQNSFNININKDSEIRLGILQFPNWKVFANGKEIVTFVPKSEEWGRIHFLLPVGSYRVKVKLYNTPIRTIGNVLSFVSCVGLGSYLMLQFKRDKRRS